MRHMAFDVSIDLVAALIPDGCPPREGVRLAREAVEALPGAGWVSVEWCGDFPPVRWLRLYRPGRAEVMEGGPWDQLRAQVEAAIAKAVAKTALNYQ